MMIDLDKFDKFFEDNLFLSKEFIEKIKDQKQEVKEKFVNSFAKHFSLVTKDELNAYVKKIEMMSKKIEELEEKL